MKSEKLQNAVGMIDEKLIKRADKQKKFSFRWISAIAACLAIVMIAGIYLHSGAPISVKASALAEAKYPEMAKYPEGEMLPDFEERYDAWSTDQRKQRNFGGAGEDLDPFFKSTISEFLKGADNKNIVYSPLNVYMALAMLAETADSESRAEILGLLGYSDIETLQKNANAVWNANYCDDNAVTSILASSLWLNENVDFKQQTLDTLAENYYASSYRGTMGSDEFDKSIQDWMNKQTGNLLKDYISEIETNPNTVMALVTTIYFQAKWENEFSESRTNEGVFHSANGDITCDFMHATETYGTYYFSDNFSATQKSLQNSGYMWFVLPDEGVSVEELLSDPDALSMLCADTSSVESKSLNVNISMPKFDVNSKIDLADGLKSLGITSCFDTEKADFSPLVNGNQKIWLDKVEHGARVAIDEEGVVATAYTEMSLCGAGMPPSDEVDFVLDRPFLFVITGRDNLPLFVGIVNCPV